MGNREFYKHAKAYDLAFSDRDFSLECDFLEWCLNNHANLRKKDLKNKSFLEMGSGPSEHAIEFARRGWHSTALDLSEDMINYAASKARDKKVKLKTMVADMTNFNLRKPVILAATLMETIAHMVTNEMLLSHFRSVAKSVVPGGIYVIEATHPSGFFPEDEPNTWVEKNGDMEVELTFGMPTDDYNTVTQQWNVTTRMKIREKGRPEYTIKTRSPFRWYLAQELKALIELSGVFDKYWFYGSAYFIPPFEMDDSEESDSMVVVLRVK